MKPATPLPWILRDPMDGIGSIDAADGTHVAQAFQVKPISEDLKQLSRRQNGAYLVHAANAYPRLVAELARLADTAEAREAANLDSTIDDARALLRELGEL